MSGHFTPDHDHDREEQRQEFNDMVHRGEFRRCGCVGADKPTRPLWDSEWLKEQEAKRNDEREAANDNS